MPNIRVKVQCAAECTAPSAASGGHASRALPSRKSSKPPPLLMAMSTKHVATSRFHPANEARPAAESVWPNDTRACFRRRVSTERLKLRNIGSRRQRDVDWVVNAVRPPERRADRLSRRPTCPPSRHLRVGVQRGRVTHTRDRRHSVRQTRRAAGNAATKAFISSGVPMLTRAQSMNGGKFRPVRKPFSRIAARN